MEDEPLAMSMVFKALAKPAMMMGVDYDYFFISSLTVMLVFIYSDNLLAFLLFFPLVFNNFSVWLITISVRAVVGAFYVGSL